MGLPMLMEVDPGMRDGPVKDAPFTAEAITTMTQTLADGNRLERSFTSRLARDGAGRLRTEQSIAMLGPMALPGEPPRMVTISDPIAGVHYMIDEARQVAMRRELRAGPPGPRPPDGVGAPATPGGPRGPGRGPGPGAPGPPPFGRGPMSGPPMGPPVMAAPPNATTEVLGARDVNGLAAEGTRITVTIAAGAMGNEKPMHLVTERWVSTELRIPVLIIRRDPRLGDTTYRLTNVERGEPSSDLFEVPAGYTVQDEPRPRGPRPPGR
jgi:hypothetical protein